MLSVRLKRLSSNAMIPSKGTKGSAYYDLYAAEDALLKPGLTRVITTGWLVEVRLGYFLDVRSRSGMASEGVFVANAPGTVDADYRGELKVILINLSRAPYYVAVGDRIAQCALMPVIWCDFEEAVELSSTERGCKGYGSTGR